MSEKDCFVYILLTDNSILEGLATVVVGIISYWMVQDFPVEATFLSSDDRARVLRRLAADKQGSAKVEVF